MPSFLQVVFGLVFVFAVFFGLTSYAVDTKSLPTSTADKLFGVVGMALIIVGAWIVCAHLPSRRHPFSTMAYNGIFPLALGQVIVSATSWYRVIKLKRAKNILD